MTNANSTNMFICIVCKSYMNKKLRVLNCHESRIAHSLAASLYCALARNAHY